MLDPPPAAADADDDVRGGENPDALMNMAVILQPDPAGLQEGGDMSTSCFAPQPVKVWSDSGESDI